jgi:hypothetical protein
LRPSLVVQTAGGVFYRADNDGQLAVDDSTVLDEESIPWERRQIPAHAIGGHIHRARATVVVSVVRPRSDRRAGERPEMVDLAS